LRVAWAVQAVVRHVPLGFVCLPQAMAAKWMLRRRRLAEHALPWTAAAGRTEADGARLAARRG